MTIAEKVAALRDEGWPLDGVLYGPEWWEL